MLAFDAYKNRFKSIHMRREDGILEIRFHTNDGPIRWGLEPYKEATLAFRTISQDHSNRVIIMTGTGDEFAGPRSQPGDFPHVEIGNADSPSVFSSLTKPLESDGEFEWPVFEATALEMMDSLLSITAPVIGAVNGPAWSHPDLPLMSDIVICTENAAFQDFHFMCGLPPGDGINVVMKEIMGLNRARYFHLTGQVVTAQQALDWGMVSEIVPLDALMDRAWELARLVARQKDMVLRHTRQLLTHELRRRMLDMVGYGVAAMQLNFANSELEALRGS